MPDVEFGSRDAANAFREDHEDALCSHDDRRLRTVTIASDAPERVVDEAVINAASSREDREGDGQVALEEFERDRIDFSEGQSSVPHARSVKAIMLEQGVSDWLSYYDHHLSTDEHREVARRAAREGGGRRMDAETTTQTRLSDLQSALEGQCDHARKHCEVGEDPACDFLVEDCGLSPDVVGSLRDPDAADTDQSRLPGPVYQALGDAWTGYKVALANDDEERARRFAAVINAIRDQQGQDPIGFERLDGQAVTWDDVDVGVEEPRVMEELPDPGLHPAELQGTALTPADIEDNSVDADRPGTRQPAQTARGMRVEPLLGHIPDDELYAELGRREAAEEIVDDRDDDAADGDEGLFREAENDPDEGGTASRQFRRAQNNGYLRTSSTERSASVREGLGQFGAAPSDTQRLDEFEDNS